jgi:hypothetical protein
MGEGSRLVRARTVTGDGVGLCSRAGLVLLAELAETVGLAAGLRQATRGLPWRRHHPGRTLGLVVLALADGARNVSDVDAVIGQEHLFGPGPSRPSSWRTFDRLGPAELRGIATAEAKARQFVWDHDSAGQRSELDIDLDATMVTTRADKQDAAPTWKRTYGHHPLLAIDAERGEVLAVLMRPGNAGSNTAVDHVTVLRDAIAVLPERERAGHQPGDNQAEVQVSVRVRCDAGGTTHWLAEECRHRNIGYSLGYAIDGRVRDALLLVQEEDWQPAVEPDGSRRENGSVYDLTRLVNLTAWPTGTRLIVRRERPHPGAQLSLFDDIDGWRHTAFITDTAGDPAALEARQRRRGRAEGVIRDLKACGLANLPFDCIVNNTAWARLAAVALNLLSWTRHLTLTGPLRRATPKTLRYRLLHIAGRTSAAGRKLHLDRDWPWTPTLLAALDRIPPTVTATT